MDLEELRLMRKKIQQEETEHFQQAEEVIAETKRVREVAANTDAIIANLEQQFEKATKLKKIDVSFLFVAVALQIVRQYAVTNFPERVDDQTAAKNTAGHTVEHSDRYGRFYDIPVERIISNPVPFDANIGANGALSGNGYMGHRVGALGHDPLLGLIFGTANIATSTLTNNHFESFHIRTNENNRDYFFQKAQTPLVLSKTKDKLLNEGVEGKKKVGVSLAKELVHLKSDLGTKNSLPLPVVPVIDGQLASDLAERGLDMCNFVTVGKQMGYAILINALVAMIHGFFYEASVDGSRKLFEMRTRRILEYSNVIASSSNLLYVGANMAVGNKDALRKLDVGGLLVTVYRIATDLKFQSELKHEFVKNEYFDMIQGKDYNF